MTGADTVIFYDSDFNPQMDRQCEDRYATLTSASVPPLTSSILHTHRAHRIGQIRDVHIYRFVSQHTVEEALLRKANQKRSLDDLVIQRGAFDWSALLADTHTGALARALGEYEDAADAQAARVAEREELELEVEDAQDFEARAGSAEGPLVTGGGADAVGEKGGVQAEVQVDSEAVEEAVVATADPEPEPDAAEEDEEEGRTVEDYMLDFIALDPDFFAEWAV